jgi:hypothetical protein
VLYTEIVVEGICVEIIRYFKQKLQGRNAKEKHSFTQITEQTRPSGKTRNGIIPIHTVTEMRSLQSMKCIKAQAELCMEQRPEFHGHPECAIHQPQSVPATNS